MVQLLLLLLYLGYRDSTFNNMSTTLKMSLSTLFHCLFSLSEGIYHLFQFQSWTDSERNQRRHHFCSQQVVGQAKLLVTQHVFVDG